MVKIHINQAEIDLGDFVSALLKDEHALEQVATALLPHIVQLPLMSHALAYALQKDSLWLSAVTDQVADRLVEAGALTFPVVEITEADREDYAPWFERHFGFDRNLARRIIRAGLTLEDCITLEEEEIATSYGISAKLAKAIVTARPKTRRLRVEYLPPDLPRIEPEPKEFSRERAYRWYRYWWKLSPGANNRICSYNYEPEQLFGSLEELLAMPGIGASTAAELLRKRRKV